MQPVSRMHRALWQIMLAMLLVAFAVQRAAIGFVLSGGEMEPSLLAAYCLQVAAALAAAVGLWLGRQWTIGAVIALGAMLVAGALLESFWLGIRPAISAASEVLIIALSTGALALVLRHEFGTKRRPSDRANPIRSGSRPRVRRDRPDTRA